MRRLVGDGDSEIFFISLLSPKCGRWHELSYAATFPIPSKNGQNGVSRMGSGLGI
jgi:hypothetical protein